LRAVPGAYVWLGTGNTDHDPGLRAPTDDFNDDMLSVGAEFWCRLSERFFAKPL
jgi:hippurate hydrolase